MLPKEKGLTQPSLNFPPLFTAHYYHTAATFSIYISEAKHFFTESVHLLPHSKHSCNLPSMHIFSCPKNWKPDWQSGDRETMSFHITQVGFPHGYTRAERVHFYFFILFFFGILKAKIFKCIFSPVQNHKMSILAAYIYSEHSNLNARLTETLTAPKPKLNIF